MHFRLLGAWRLGFESARFFQLCELMEFSHVNSLFKAGNFDDFDQKKFFYKILISDTINFGTCHLPLSSLL